MVDVTQHSDVFLLFDETDKDGSADGGVDGGSDGGDVRLCSIFKYRTVISRMSAFSSFVGRVPCVIATVFFKRISLSASNESLMRARRFFSINGFRFFKRRELNLNEVRC